MSPTKREQIIEAAHSMFLSQGFGACSMDGIAAKANVSKRTVYSHFANKDALFREVVSEFCTRMCGSIQEIDPNSSIDEKLRQIGWQLVGIILHPEAMATLRIVMAEKDQFPSLAQAFWEAGPARHLGIIAELLSTSEELETGNPMHAAGQFAGMLKGPYFLASLLGVIERPSDQEIETHINLTVDRFLTSTRKSNCRARR